MKIRLLIADDHEVIREGLRMIFEGTELHVVAEAKNGQQAFEALRQHAIDVVLMDISMPVADGFRFLELSRTAGSAVPVIMHSVDHGHVRRCRELGANGFVLKGEDNDVLLTAVRMVHAGSEFWSTAAAS